MSALTEALDLNFLRPSDIERIRTTVKQDPSERHILNETLRAHIRDFISSRGSPSSKNAAEYDELIVTLVKLSNAGVMHRTADGKFIIKVRDADKNRIVDFGDFIISLSKSGNSAVSGRKNKKIFRKKSGVIDDTAPKKYRTHLRNRIGRHTLSTKKVASLG